MRNENGCGMCLNVFFLSYWSASEIQHQLRVMLTGKVQQTTGIETAHVDLKKKDPTALRRSGLSHCVHVLVSYIRITATSCSEDGVHLCGAV
jgi:hypothetical protein